MTCFTIHQYQYSLANIKWTKNTVAMFFLSELKVEYIVRDPTEIICC